jgi:Family of unknown function (DUF6459)
VPPSEWPALRLVEIPDAAPPYDCETHGTLCPAARAAVQADPCAGGAARAAGSRAGRARPGGPPAAADPTAGWLRQFAQAMVEILAGVRPPGQIVPWTTDRARAQVRRLSPLLVCDRRPTIQRVLVSRPAASVLEMTVVVSLGPRSRALALRLDYVRARPAAPGRPARPARWLCTAIEAG